MHETVRDVCTIKLTVILFIVIFISFTKKREKVNLSCSVNSLLHSVGKCLNMTFFVSDNAYPSLNN